MHTTEELLQLILTELRQINQRDARMEEAMQQQRAFSSTAMMQAMNAMGQGGNLDEMFKRMALGKEDKTDV